MAFFRLCSLHATEQTGTIPTQRHLIEARDGVGAGFLGEIVDKGTVARSHQKDAHDIICCTSREVIFQHADVGRDGNITHPAGVSRSFGLLRWPSSSGLLRVFPSVLCWRKARPRQRNSTFHEVVTHVVLHSMGHWSHCVECTWLP